jgi:Tfp pilus assembly pilus retraction ATPase PilT
MNAVLIDWQVKVSQYIEVIEVKPMSIDMSRTRLKPIFLSSGELFIVVPAVSENAAEEKAKNIARHIASAGAWGMEIFDHPVFLASIEKLL